MLPRFAIIDDNALTRLGLQNILEDIIPMAEIVPLQGFDEYTHTDITGYAHCFVSSRIYFEHATFFRENHVRCIVMVSGEMNINGVATINVCQSEKNLVRDILALNRQGHGAQASQKVSDGSKGFQRVSEGSKGILTPRETEVAILLCKGCISKEVADKLNISLNTAITHRQNIIEKLHARSLADIIVYAVRHGLLDLSEI